MNHRSILYCDIVATNRDTVYVRTSRGLFRFDGDGVEMKFRDFVETISKQTGDVDRQIGNLLHSIGAFSAPINDGSMFLGEHVHLLRTDGDYSTVASHERKMPPFIGCMNYRGQICIRRVDSGSGRESIKRFRERFILAVDDQEEYSVARSVLRGGAIMCAGLTRRARRNILSQLSRNAQQSTWVFDCQSGLLARGSVGSIASSFFEEYVGPGNIVYDVKMQRHRSRFWAFAHYAIPSARVERIVSGSWGVGRDSDVGLALTKAIAEATERYGSGTYDDSALVKASFDEIREEAIDPRSIIRYAPWQYRRPEFFLKPFLSTRSYRWVAGEDLSGKRRFVLADQVYYPFEHGPYPFAFANSCGVAAHLTKHAAITNAVLELIERDAVMRVWRHRLITPFLHRGSYPDSVNAAIRRLARAGYDVAVRLADFSIIPTVLVAVRARDSMRWPNFSCSAATHPILDQALQKAIDEVEAGLCTIGKRPSHLSSPDSVRHVADHGLFAALPKHRKIYSDFYFQSGPVSKPVEITRWRRVVDPIEVIRASLLSLVSVRLTPISTIGRSKLEVYRTFVPGLVPMTFGYGLEPLGLPAMRCAPTGSSRDLLALDTHGNMPHPFA